MITFTQAAVLGLLQGVTELFPISSLGHTVILPSLLGWHLDQAAPQFVGFVVLTHFATALVLLGFFWRDWVRIICGVLRSLYQREINNKDTYGKLGWLIIVSTVPVGILGLLFEKQLTQLFADPRLVAGILVLNGVVLYGAEKLRTKAPEGKGDDAALARLTWKQAIGIGCAQCFALIPGFSRTGLTMTGSLVNGLSHENAARYAFLLATPVIFAAALLKVPDVFTGGGVVLFQSLFGALCSGIAAYFSIRFLTKYFESKTLTPFAIYCVAAGVAFLALLG
jgi:undecaprenyl-diphosphatase